MHPFKSMTLVCMLVFVAIAMAEDAAPSEEPPKMFEPDSAILFERFDEGWKERWQPSANDKFKDGEDVCARAPMVPKAQEPTSQPLQPNAHP